MQDITNITSLMSREESCVILVDVQEKLINHIIDKDKLIKHCKWLMQLAEELNIPIIISEQYPKGLSSTVDELRHCVADSHFIEKVHFSCYGEPSFKNLLTRLNKSQFVLAGIETHVCVLQTALDLQFAGFKVFVAADSVGSRHLIDHKYGLKRMRQKEIELVTTEMIFFEWIKKAGTEEFKLLSKKFIRNKDD